MPQPSLLVCLAAAGVFALAGAGWALSGVPRGQRAWAWIPAASLGVVVAWGFRAAPTSALLHAAPAAAAPVGTGSGKRLVRILGCVGCHSEDGSRRIGPSFLGLFGSRRALEGGVSVLADEAYVRRSILDSRAQIVQGYPATMPEFGGKLGDTEVRELIAYLRSLGGPERRSP